MYLPVPKIPFGEDESVGRDLEITEVSFGSLQGIEIGHRQAEVISVPVPPPEPIAPIDPQRAVAANEAGEVSPPIIGVFLRRRTKRANTHEFVVRRQERTLIRPMLGSCDELPPTFSEKSMISAGNESRFVLKCDLVSGLARFPLRKYLCLHEMPIGALPHRAVDAVAGSHFSNRFVGTVRHQDSCLRSYAKYALVLATSIRVNGPLERHSLHAIEDGFRLNLNPLGMRGNPGSACLEQSRAQRMFLRLHSFEVFEQICRTRFHRGLDGKPNKRSLSIPNTGGTELGH